MHLKLILFVVFVSFCLSMMVSAEDNTVENVTSIRKRGAPDCVPRKKMIKQLFAKICNFCRCLLHDKITLPWIVRDIFTSLCNLIIDYCPLKGGNTGNNCLHVWHWFDICGLQYDTLTLQPVCGPNVLTENLKLYQKGYTAITTACNEAHDL